MLKSIDTSVVEGKLVFGSPVVEELLAGELGKRVSNIIESRKHLKGLKKINHKGFIDRKFGLPQIVGGPSLEVKELFAMITKGPTNIDTSESRTRVEYHASKIGDGYVDPQSLGLFFD